MKEFSHLQVGTKNFCKFLLKYEEETQRPKIITALYRVEIKNIQDYLYLRSSLHRAGQLVDKLSFLITNDLTDLNKSLDFIKGQFKLSEYERDLFDKINEDNSIEKLTELINHISDIEKEDIYVDVWNSSFNERDERNKCIENARKLGTDYMFSIDSDEVVEERFTKEMLHKIVNHPSPIVLGYLITWRNHWESPSIVNSTFPIGDDGRLTGAMLGIRLWKDIGQNIVGGNAIGLHCGNSPPIATVNVLHINLSMRHFSLLRKEDRQYKFNNYNRIDPAPDKSMGTNNYNHIIKSDLVKVSEYSPRTGILCNMLFYEGENIYDMFKWMNGLYTVMDDLNVTWTGIWKEEDKVWNDFLDHKDWPTKNNWYKTGPSYEAAHTFRLYSADIVHIERTDDIGFAELRNYGLDILRERKSKYTKWGTFFDPDEMSLAEPISFQRALTSCSHRNTEFGFIFKYSNYNSQGNTAYSESIRMFNIDMDIVRFSGKVHESLSDSLDALMNNGYGITCSYFPYTMVNKGLILSKEKSTEKLKKYTKMVLKQIEDDPIDTSAWHSLAMQFSDNKDHKKFLIAAERAVLCAGHKYLAFETLAAHHIRVARDLYKMTFDRLEVGHAKYNYVYKLLEFLNKNCPSVLSMDHDEFSIELPDFPYDIIEDIDNWERLITHDYTRGR
jgi:hypothetical protein